MRHGAASERDYIVCEVGTSAVIFPAGLRAKIRLDAWSRVPIPRPCFARAVGNLRFGPRHDWPTRSRGIQWLRATCYDKTNSPRSVLPLEREAGDGRGRGAGARGGGGHSPGCR